MAMATGKVDKLIYGLIGGLLVMVLLTALAPTIFSSIFGLNESEGVPTWLKPVLFVVSGIGLVFIAWRAFSN